MLKVGLIILALIGLVGTTTTKAFASDAVTPLCTGPADSGGGGGGSSSQGPSDTTTSPGANNMPEGGLIAGGSSSVGQGQSATSSGSSESTTSPSGDEEPYYHHHYGIGDYGHELGNQMIHFRHHMFQVDTLDTGMHMRMLGHNHHFHHMIEDYLH